jgi:transcriptional regulator NrdR family protein
MPRPTKDNLGLRCWNCNHRKLRVVYTRAACAAKIVRLRECRNCGKRVMTCARIMGGDRPMAVPQPLSRPA